MISTRHGNQTGTPPGRHEGVRVTIVSDAAPHRNGVGSYYCDLGSHLRGRLGHIRLVCPTKKNSGMYLLSFPMPGDASQHIRVPNAPVVWNRLKRTRPDVIIVPSPGLFGLLGLCFAAHYKIPLVVGLHTDYDQLTSLYWKGMWRRITRRYLHIVNALLVRRSDVVMAANNELVSVAERLGSARVERIGSIIPRQFVERPVPPPAHNRIQRVLFAGRLAHEKNLPAVIAAAKALPQIAFSLAGEGPLRQMVETEAERLPNLTYLGWLSRRHLMRELDRADLLVLPSHLETFGTVAMEAAARGCLVLVSNRCGLLDWDDISANILKTEAGEPLWKAITRAVDLAPEQRRSMRVNSRYATQQFNLSTVNRWEDVLSSLASGKALST